MPDRPHVVVNHKLPLVHGCAAALCKPGGSQGDLSLKGCLVLSCLVTMTMYKLATALFCFLIAGFQMAFSFLAFSPVKPEFVCAACLPHGLLQPIRPQCQPTC